MKKFTSNDIFYNTLLASPKYTIILHSGSLRINDQINQNLEKSSSISSIDYPGTYHFRAYSGSYEYTASIGREFIYGLTVASKLVFHPYVTNYSSIKKVASLKNIFSVYKTENEYANINYYLTNDGIPQTKQPKDNPAFTPLATSSSEYFITPTSSIGLLEIPTEFYGNYIKPGSVQLNMYITGVLAASAKDTDKTGKLFQTYGSGSGNTIGSIFYDHGILLLTGAYAISTQQSPYIQPLPQYTASFAPTNDYLKWIYFGAYQVTTGSAIQTKYELIFQGTNFIPTLTMLCSAEKGELFWSNNRTFLESDHGDENFIGQSTSSINSSGGIYYASSGSVIVPSSKILKENKTIMIKNTISSSFAHYSSSYEPQVFISQVGIYDKNKNLIAIAKLANPVRKTKELDYTIKLKLDM